tara:strand:+ start:735 stop:1592 length:858 start_codon:yes stop_codon:yes gene_type:complete
MKLLRRVLFLSPFFLFHLACSDDNNEAVVTDVIEAYESLDVSYGPDLNQTFDIFLPANRTNMTKTIILVHGGSWVGGDKSDMDFFKAYILQRHPNIGIVNMNYTLADETTPPIPLQTDDISAVVSYISENKSSLIISDDIGFIGASAGAHLSLLWSYANDSNNQVDMVCSIVGPTNFTDPAYHDSLNPIYQGMYLLFGNPSVDFLESMSPYHRATNSAPPTLLFYGGMDPLVPSSQGIDMDAKLTTLGVSHEFSLYQEEGHGWEGLNQLDTSLKISAYIDTYLIP